MSVKRQGVSLIEALVALGLLVVFFAGSSVLTFRHLDNSNRVIDLGEVRMLAEQSMEAIQSIAYEDWTQMIDGTYGLSDVGVTWAFQSNPDVINDYTRTVTVYPVERDGDCNIVDSGGIEDDDTKLITVSIAWVAASGSQLREFNQYFTNWKNPSGCLNPVFFYAIHGNAHVNMSKTSGVVNGDINSGGEMNQGYVVVNGTINDHSPVLIPMVDFAAYRAEADHYLSGNQIFTTGTYGGIWYVDGNVTIDSGVSFDGTVVATGDIRFINSASVAFNPTGPYPALVTLGNIEGNNSSSIAINGIAFAMGNIILNNAISVAVHGSLIANGNFEIKNGAAFSVTYDQDITQNPPPYFD
ncbi:MAG: hypothetical protein ABIH67_02785 [Candidatus Uhrbacteria bacterium]